jgi:hypothetical protein
MSHLSTERLAALGDEEPTAVEAAHLAACADCARERSAYRTLVAMARTERDAIGIPLTRWDSIADAMATGQSTPMPTLVAHDRVAFDAPRGRTLRFTRMPVRAAAGLLLLAGGAIAGRLSAGAPLWPIAATGSEVAAQQADGGDRGTPAGRERTPATFASVEEARAAQLRSESMYQQAAAFLAEHDSVGSPNYSPEMMKSRLAALDQIESTTREAMRAAPHDPVINGYYLTTVGQREVALRQLNTALPASLGSNSF